MATLCINLSALEFTNSQKSPETENLPVKARLEASVKPEPKTPEALAEELKKAARLKEAHVEATRMRAARVVERSVEGKKRVVRAAAAKAEKVQRRLDFADAHAASRREESRQEMQSKLSHRKDLARTVQENRQEMAAAAALKAASEARRCEEAAARAAKALERRSSSGAFEVKKAVAAASAHKEAERERRASLGADIDAKLDGAASRRTEVIGTPRKAAPLGSRTDGGARSVRLGREAESRQAAAALNRETALAAVVAKASAVSERAAAVTEAQAAAKSLRERVMYEKQQAAAVRRYVQLGRAARKSVIVDVPGFGAGGATPAPPALVARLMRRTHREGDAEAPVVVTSAPSSPGGVTAASEASHARHEAAAARLAKAVEARKSKAAARASRVIAAAATRQAKAAAKARFYEERAARVDGAAAVAAAAAKAKAVKFNARVVTAREARVLLRFNQLKKLAAKANKVDAAERKKGASRVGTTASRALLVKNKRASMLAAVLARSAAAQAKVAAADARRANIQSARISKAKMSAILRSTPVKLSASPTGEVTVKIAA